MRHQPTRPEMFRRLPLCVSLCLFVSSTIQAAPPDAKSGLYAIWYSGDPEKYLSQPYIKGGQIVVQWADVEVARGQYDFSAIDKKLADLHNKGHFTTIQINGNRKPAWLFGHVPYIERKLSVQVKDPQGTLMFWHPTHRDAYLSMLRALAAYLKNSTYGDTLLGLRMNLNAIGTEHHYIEPEIRPLDRWAVPDRTDATNLVPWSRELADQYIGSVMDTYIDAFRGTARIFVRNGIPEELEARYRDDFARGTLSWFHTSSEAEPRATFAERKYQRFVNDCRSGKTTAYAEPWASTWGHHGGLADDRWCSPPQWGYWRLLFDLHCGVSYIALYSTDMRVAVEGVYQSGDVRFSDPGGAYQREFNAAFDFASKYVGYHACPEQSPGAWVAFRENSTVRAANGIPEERRKLAIFNDDYNFLMRRLPGDASFGEDVVNVGPDDQRFGAWARVLPPGGSIRLELDAAFVASLRDQESRIILTYLDQGKTSCRLLAGGKELEVMGRGTRRWETASLAIPARQLKPEADGAHIRVIAGQQPVHLHMVEVKRID